MSRIRKAIVVLFISEGDVYHYCHKLDRNLIDFLEISLNLDPDKFFLYRRPNITHIYISSKSNHPTSITKQLSSMTSRRISTLSSI